VPGPAGSTPATVATGAVTRTFDNDDRMTKVKDWLNNTTSFAYNRNGAVSSITRPDGTRSTNTLDVNDVVTKISDIKSGGFSWVATYTRTDAGLLKSQAETGVPAQPNPSYVYDALARLTSTGATAGQGYGYDDADNPTRIVRGLVTANQVFDPANQLTAITDSGGQSTATLGYSPLGERTMLTPTTGSATSYSYDQASQLRAYTGPDTSGAAIAQTYGYDATGTRTYTQAAGTRTHHTWDTSGDLPLMIEDGSSAYIYGPEGIPIQQILPGGVVRYLHHDQLGSIRAMTDQAGVTIATYSYDPYGKPLTSTGSSSNPFRYAGQYTDATGLQYLRARYYDPETAQFLTRDPLEAQTRAPYGYADNTPVNATDPSGMLPSLQGISDAIAGAGDEITVGLTKKARQAIGSDGTDYCSNAYAAGQSGGVALSIAIPGGGPRRAIGLLGRNAKYTGSRVLTDLPGGRSTAKSIFRHRTRGQPVEVRHLADGGRRRFAPDGTQIRMHADGSTRIDLPGSRETIHFGP
jgi:RHS repeat-associated protein